MQELLIQPEYITESIVELLEADMPKKTDLSDLSPAQSLLIRQIAVIPALKNLLSLAVPLIHSSGRITGRILELRGNSHRNGKFIIFQERTSIEENSEHQNKNPRKNIQIIPHVYNDIFSAARSQ